MAEPFLNKNMHPTVIIRGYTKALEDALEIVEKLSFPIELEDTKQVLNVVQTSLQTKFTSRFGTLMAVALPPGAHVPLSFFAYRSWPSKPSSALKLTWAMERKR